ncbi:sigma-70 family RNA polymerase sigma factor [Myxococcota bacterium]|nr:sigma-70 family RNA polymerase sigma factor [Myxococcota bacterium]
MTQNDQLRAEELTLLTRLLHGESSAFSEFYRRYQRLVASCIRKVFFKWTFDFTEDEIDDMISTVFLSFLQDDYKKLRMFDPGRGYRLSTWVGIITTNATVDHIRKNARPTVSLDDTERKVAQPRSMMASPVENAEREEESRLLMAAIATLSPGDREFLELAYDAQLAPEEIGVRLGLNINTVYSKKNKILHKLMDAVAELSTVRLKR